MLFWCKFLSRMVNMHFGKIFCFAAGVGATYTIIGGLVGLIVGGVFDYFYQYILTPTLRRSQINQNLSVSLIVLHAKIAKADGSVTPNEVKKFRQLVNIKEGDEAAVGELFDMARTTMYGYEEYARIVFDILQHNPTDLTAVLVSLFQLASVDGGISPEQQGILYGIGTMLGFSQNEIAILEKSFANSSQGQSKKSKSKKQQQQNTNYQKQENFTETAIGDKDPYQVLGIDKSADLKAIKKEYRRLIRGIHPDKLKGEGATEREIKFAEKRMAELNAAYDAIVGK